MARGEDPHKSRSRQSLQNLDRGEVVILSDTSSSAMLRAALRRGRVREIGAKLYTRDLDTDLEQITRTHTYRIVSLLFPQAVIVDDSALKGGRVADDGLLFIAHPTKHRSVQLPGLYIVPRKGVQHSSDMGLPQGLALSGVVRTLLDNLRQSRSTKNHRARTSGRIGVEQRLDAIARQQGAESLNAIRDQARTIAKDLDRDAEYKELESIIGTLLGTQSTKLFLPVSQARAAGMPFDTQRYQLLLGIAESFKNIAPEPLPAIGRAERRKELPFFEAYFSNFIEGTKFDLADAEKIIDLGVESVGSSRKQDAHDVKGTYDIVSNDQEMQRIPHTFDEFISLLRNRHALMMAGHPSARPGEFKILANRAGDTLFVQPTEVEGTLYQGFEILKQITDPFHRAAFMKFLITEVHPFDDGNGRMARIMMNAELHAAGEQRIIIPTIYRTNYLLALTGLTNDARRAGSYLSMLSYARRWTNAIDFSDRETAKQQLEETQALMDPQLADRVHEKLLMPDLYGGN